MTQELMFDDFVGVPKTTAEVLQQAALLAPDVEAVVTSTQRIDYRQLHTSVNRLQHALVEAGVRKGDYVALCLGNGIPWIVFFYALTGIGAVVVPINTRLKASEVEYQLVQARVRFVFSASKVLSTDFVSILSDVCPGLNTELPSTAMPNLEKVFFVDDECPQGAHPWDLETILNNPTESVGTTGVERVTAEDPALVQFTSGTTSRPKGALLRHGSIALNSLVSSQRMGLRQGDRYFSARPFFHVAGSTLSVLSSAQSQTTLVSLERFTSEAALQIMADERCTHFSGNDTIAQMLMNDPHRANVELNLRGAWLAASAPTVERAIQELGAKEVVVGYGLSEASPNVAQSAWHEPADTRIHGWLKPQPGVQVRIADHETDVELEVDVPGEIQVRGWNVMAEYLHDPERTAETFTADGWLKTGDLGVMRHDGRMRFTGRLKEIIRVGGENVSPAEIEDVLLTHPHIKQAAVVGVPDERLVEVPFAFVVLDDPNGLPSHGIQEWIKQEIAGFKVPKYVHVVSNFDDFGMTASSKIQKTELAKKAVALLVEK